MSATAAGFNYSFIYGIKMVDANFKKDALFL
jgi:hypothetical protein